MGILTKYLPQFALKAPKKLFLPFNSPLWIFFENFFPQTFLGMYSIIMQNVRVFPLLEQKLWLIFFFWISDNPGH